MSGASIRIASSMRPRKTEYRQITFASKAEARFALFLDDQKKCWWYEPESLRLPDGYVPDFMIADLEPMEFDDESQKGNAIMELTIVEYKPRRPTKTYINELADRVGQMGDQLHKEHTLDIMASCVVSCGFELMVGGMGYDKAEHLGMSWNGPQRTAWVAKKWRPSWGHVFDGVDPDKENKRLSGFRFDLESRPSE